MRFFNLVSTTCVTESIYSLAALEAKLVSYVNDPETSGQPFDTSSVPKVSRRQAAMEAAREIACLVICP
jgi:coatomer subunit gamma